MPVSCEDIFTLLSVRIRLVTQLVELNLHMILIIIIMGII